MILELILSSILLSAGQVPQNIMTENPDSSAIAAAINWQESQDEVQSASFSLTLFGVPATLSIARYPIDKLRTYIVDCQDSLAVKTSVTAAKYDAAAAVNGSFFDMKHLTPVTYFYSEGREIYSGAPGNTNVSGGLLCIGNDGHDVTMVRADTINYVNLKKHYDQILAAGPLLVQDGRTCAIDTTIRFNLQKAPRTVIGRSSNYVWMIVIDGRFPEHAVGTTIPQTAKICVWLGLEQALNLDGGGSSTLWISDVGVINHPYDNHCWDHAGERRVPNIIIARY